MIRTLLLLCIPVAEGLIYFGPKLTKWFTLHSKWAEPPINIFHCIDCSSIQGYIRCVQTRRETFKVHLI